MSRAPAPPYDRAALLGTGLIGGSLTLALKQAGVVRTVVGHDLDAARAGRALERGIVDEVAARAAEAVAGADLVVLAVPVGATLAVCEAIGPALGNAPSVLVTDVGSTKVEVLRAIDRALPFPDRFVGAHPMAGTERSGPDAASAALFADRLCLLTPAPGTRPDALAACARLWQAAGARVRQMEPALHDQAMALVSHLPHAAAFALAAAVGDAAVEPGASGRAIAGLSGGGFIDTTRIAASDAVMWRDVFLSNREALLAALDRLERQLSLVRRAVASGDGLALVEWIERARAGRRAVLTTAGKDET